MKIQTKLKKIGDSYFTLIPANVRNELELVPNSLVELEIKKIEDLSITYECSLCNYQFDTDDEPYCPICGDTENLKEVENESKRI